MIDAFGVSKKLTRDLRDPSVPLSQRSGEDFGRIIRHRSGRKTAKAIAQGRDAIRAKYPDNPELVERVLRQGPDPEPKKDKVRRLAAQATTRPTRRASEPRVVHTLGRHILSTLLKADDDPFEVAKAMKLPTSMVRRMADGAPRDAGRVKRLAQEIDGSGQMDPLAIQLTGKGPRLMNGHHRLGVAEAQGRKMVPVRIRVGRYNSVKDPSSPVYKPVSKSLPSYLRKTPKAMLSPELQRRVRLHEMGRTAARAASRAKQNPPYQKPYERPRQLTLFDRSRSGKVTPSYNARRKP
jgi:hypothetical protein